MVDIVFICFFDFMRIKIVLRNAESALKSSRHIGALYNIYCKFRTPGMTDTLDKKISARDKCRGKHAFSRINDKREFNHYLLSQLLTITFTYFVVIYS